MVGIVVRLSMGSPTRPWICPLAGLVPALLVLVGGQPVAPRIRHPTTITMAEDWCQPPPEPLARVPLPPTMGPMAMT